MRLHVQESLEESIVGCMPLLLQECGDQLRKAAALREAAVTEIETLQNELSTLRRSDHEPAYPLHILN